MSEQPAAATGVRLARADARELADLLLFLHDWLTSSEDGELLAASLDRCPDSVGTDTLPQVQLALTRFRSLLTPTDPSANHWHLPGQGQ
ncbi:MAG: hypothetical protein ACRDT6_08385 [Micromonosporaceae bacterium]